MAGSRSDLTPRFLARLRPDLPVRMPYVWHPSMGPDPVEVEEGA
ncbi:hypothetical protein ACWEV4_29635 [Streptomyces sp. NPDC003860]